MDAMSAVMMQTAMTQQALSMAMLKQSMQAGSQIADMLMESAASVPVSSTRGSALNISV